MLFSLSCSLEEASKMMRVILYWYTRQAECHVEIPACFRFNLSLYTLANVWVRFWFLAVILKKNKISV